MSQAPTTREELEQTTFFKAGVSARLRKDSLLRAVSCMRQGTWQYQAFIDGFDSVMPKRARKTKAPA
jgi:hypothetical protein